MPVTAEKEPPTKPEQDEEEFPQLTTRRDFVALGFGLSLMLGAVGACEGRLRTTKA